MPDKPTATDDHIRAQKAVCPKCGKRFEVFFYTEKPTRNIMCPNWNTCQGWLKAER